MTITVLYNNVTSLYSGDPEDLLADEDSVKTAKEIKDQLVDLGHKAELFEVNEDSVQQVKKIKTDLFFNQVFGIGNTPNSEGEFAGLLEKTNIPFTGSPKKAIDLSNNKLKTKELLIKNNIPTPHLYTDKSDLKFPLIVKLADSHCSIGLSQKSVVNSKSGLQDQILSLSKKYTSPVLIEEFIDGRELNVCILGNGDSAKVLPISEILFSKSFTKFRIIDFAAKWLEKSEEYQGTLGADCPANLSPDIASRVNEIALAAYKISGCKDYGRVDIRLGVNNEPYVLEVNANPGIGKGDGANRSAKAAGMSYSQFIAQIVEVATSR